MIDSIPTRFVRDCLMAWTGMTWLQQAAFLALWLVALLFLDCIALDLLIESEESLP